MMVRRSLMIVVIMVCATAIYTLAWSYTWPVENDRPLTSTFGPRCYSGADWHAGIDIDDNGVDTDILAVDDGLVYLVSPSINQPPGFGGYQFTIIIAHGLGPIYEYVGYHHIQSADDILVLQGQSINEGDVIAHLNYNHFHCNYWANAPTGDDDTIHPLRMFGGSGAFELYVVDNSPTVCALELAHFGQTLRASVGVAHGPYDIPFFIQEYDYEGNVRSDMSAQVPTYIPGDCFWGYPSSVIGVSPTDFQANTLNSTFFTYPCESGTWTVNLMLYTFAQDVDGNFAYIDAPVSRFFGSARATIVEGVVRIGWRVNEEDAIEDDFIVLKGTALDNMNPSGLVIGRQEDLEFYVLDENVYEGITYHYEVQYWQNSEEVASQRYTIGLPVVGQGAALRGIGPNPIGEGGTNISMYVPFGRTYRLSIYDLRGCKVREISSGRSSGQVVNHLWSGKDENGMKVPAGCYFVLLNIAGTERIVEKVMVMR
jgi:hypothetical protein